MDNLHLGTSTARIDADVPFAGFAALADFVPDPSVYQEAVLANVVEHDGGKASRCG